MFHETDVVISKSGRGLMSCLSGKVHQPHVPLAYFGRGCTIVEDQFGFLMEMEMEMVNNNGDLGVIPSISDRSANEANITAIDRLVRPPTYQYIVAWGKLLGFTPATVQQQIEQAERDCAPADAIQKIDGKWLRLEDIENGENRNQVERLAVGGNAR